MNWTDKQREEFKSRLMKETRDYFKKLDEDYLKHLRGEDDPKYFKGIFSVMQHNHLYKLIKPTKLNKDGTPLWECSCGEVKASM